MDTLARMDQSVETVVHDIHIVLDRVGRLRKDMRSLPKTRSGETRIPEMNELLADIQARIEGIEAFVQACQKRAHREEVPTDEFDLWM